MTSKERMIMAMLNKQPDRVPVAPDMSNMIPCRLTGKPYWDIYLYNDPPLWKAYIEAVKHFGFDGWLPAYGDIEVVDENTFIVCENDERIITRKRQIVNGEEVWSKMVCVYPRSSPATCVDASKVHMIDKPDWFKPIKRKPIQQTDFEKVKEAMALMGDKGVVGFPVWIPLIGDPDQIYRYYDEYDNVKSEALERESHVEQETRDALDAHPDFIFVGYSGGLTFQTPDMFRDIALPSVQKITKITKEAGVPSQMHCCGRAREMVQMMAMETDMTSFNPLEILPMGDCDLAEVKAALGDKIGLMGNLHTTNVMLFGSVELVRLESLRAIRDAGMNGGFILSTGDQCGRDTPDENIYEMIKVVEEFGYYPLDMEKIEKEIKRIEEKII
jgi:uroporphyrinogen decarboxylase